eukprot:c11612_g2_i1.p2 GENE.c11612_g2_i1~~c11612_g2_i1.p2  ORF type:complete len:124 (+),score=32.52 c11612_g2_i1:356-727(+)
MHAHYGKVRDNISRKLGSFVAEPSPMSSKFVSVCELGSATPQFLDSMLELGKGMWSVVGFAGSWAVNWVGKRLVVTLNKEEVLCWIERVTKLEGGFKFDIKDGNAGNDDEEETGSAELEQEKR